MVDSRLGTGASLLFGALLFAWGMTLVSQAHDLSDVARACPRSSASCYIYDPATSLITTVFVEPDFDVHAAHYASTVHEGMTPGSYAPAVH